ncbi:MULTISPECIES: orotidine-5'-phosphate decarboxylase [Subtercola]|uniref:Orotidine-5'-phosphate decarboxylase n=1 Tax=Subtercola vilae TaxID=2056433 RepID=A0A4T2C1Y2_9MICO|nr:MULTISPECIES: orotidine-5'-phosphate decarboxylase [Subtercola]MEA9985101.1 orotidine-5'-phosphate decarboxylase [Subtercola sp. RTI3]TIH37699.1 orotidine-5'-phosphate decarboxylase [Subtercola vilae]
MTTPVPFGERLAITFATLGQLCVGIDPHDYLLDAWELPRTAAGVREFGLRVVDAAAGRVGIVKPQVAFFELFGSAGVAALEEVMAAARAAGLLVIADAKRGDIGTSAEAYGRAWLQPGSPLEADAVTLTAYAGVGSLQAVFDLAESTGKGAFVLSATSNPESFTLQSARTVGAPTISGATSTPAATAATSTPAAKAAAAAADYSVAGLVAHDVSTHNRARSGGGSHLGNIGLVLGATKNLLDYSIDRDALAANPMTPVLAPGFGFQGARFSDVHSVFGPLTPGTVVAVSRSVLAAGSASGSGTAGMADAITRQSGELADALAGARS